MEREKAVKVIKQIFQQCQSIEGKSIKLMPQKADSVLSKECQIYIQARYDDILESCVKDIAKANKLAVQKEGEFLIIYRPDYKSDI